MSVPFALRGFEKCNMRHEKERVIAETRMGESR
jgi:hypothetical protein